MKRITRLRRVVVFVEIANNNKSSNRFRCLGRNAKEVKTDPSRLKRGKTENLGKYFHTIRVNPMVDAEIEMS